MTAFLHHTSDHIESKIQAWAEQQSQDYTIQTIINKYIELYNTNRLSALPEEAITLLQCNRRNYWTLLHLLQTSTTQQQLATFLRIMLEAKSTLQLAVLVMYPLTHEYFDVVHSEADEVAFFSRYDIKVTACEREYWTGVRADWAAAGNAAAREDSCVDLTDGRADLTEPSGLCDGAMLSRNVYQRSENVDRGQGGENNIVQRFARFCASAFSEGEEFVGCVPLEWLS